MSSSPDSNCSQCEGTGYNHVYEQTCGCGHKDSVSASYSRHQPSTSSTSNHSTRSTETTPAGVVITVVFLRIFGHLFLLSLGLFLFYLGIIVEPGTNIAELFSYTGIIILILYGYKILSFISNIVIP